MAWLWQLQPISVKFKCLWILLCLTHLQISVFVLFLLFHLIQVEACCSKYTHAAGYYFLPARVSYTQRHPGYLSYFLAFLHRIFVWMEAAIFSWNVSLLRKALSILCVLMNHPLPGIVHEALCPIDPSRQTFILMCDHFNSREKKVPSCFGGNVRQACAHLCVL